MTSLRGHNRPARVLMTKIGLDGHDRGSRLVANFLREAGMDVVYTGPWQKIADVVEMARSGDIDVIGISSLATDHLIVPKLMAALQAAGLQHVAVVIGGIVPDQDLDMLHQAGVARIFHPGSSREDIVTAILDLVATVHQEELGVSG